MANVIEYTGKDKWKKKATDLLNQGGSGGTDDYDDLINKPSINNVTLEGAMDLEDIFGDRYHFSMDVMSIATGDISQATAANPVYEIGFTTAGGAELFITKHTSASSGETRWLNYSKLDQLLRWTGLSTGFDIYPQTYASASEPYYGAGICIEVPVNDDPADGIYRVVYSTDSINLYRVIGGASQTLISVQLSELHALEGITGNVEDRLDSLETDIDDKVTIGSNFEGFRIPMTVNGGSIIETPFLMQFNSIDNGLDFVYYYEEEQNNAAAND